MADIKSLRVLTSSESMATASSGGGALGEDTKFAEAAGSAASELFAGDEAALSACDSDSSTSSAPSVSVSANDNRMTAPTSSAIEAMEM